MSRASPVSEFSSVGVHDELVGDDRLAGRVVQVADAGQRHDGLDALAVGLEGAVGSADDPLRSDHGARALGLRVEFPVAVRVPGGEQEGDRGPVGNVGVVAADDAGDGRGGSGESGGRQRKREQRGGEERADHPPEAAQNQGGSDPSVVAQIATVALQRGLTPLGG